MDFNFLQVNKLFRILSLFILLPAIPMAAFAGTIQGTAIYSSDFKPLPPLNTGKYKIACGSEIQDESLLIENKKVANVVVQLKGKGLGGKHGEYKIDQKKCRYEPHVMAMMKDSELVIHSSDAINHNIHSFSFENDPMNIMFIPGQEDATQEFEEPEIVKIECDLHSWMTAWVVVTENSFFAVSDGKGAFEIANVPPGDYTLTAWHETLGEMSQKVTVGEGVAEVEFDFPEITPQVSKK